jgi:hypothetical protein
MHAAYIITKGKVSNHKSTQHRNKGAQKNINPATEAHQTPLLPIDYHHNKRHKV